MNFGNFGMGEMLVLLVIVLVLFGARRVPEIGASIGKGIREFKRNIGDVDRQIREPDPEPRAERLTAAREAAPPVRRDEDAPEPKRLLS